MNTVNSSGSQPALLCFNAPGDLNETAVRSQDQKTTFPNSGPGVPSQTFPGLNCVCKSRHKN